MRQRAWFVAVLFPILNIGLAATLCTLRVVAPEVVTYIGLLVIW